MTLVVVLAPLGVPMAFRNKINHLAALPRSRSADSGAFATGQLRAQARLFLDMRERSIRLTQIGWGIWLLPLGVEVVRSGFLPGVLGILVAIAGAGQRIDG